MFSKKYIFAYFMALSLSASAVSGMEELPSAIQLKFLWSEGKKVKIGHDLDREVTPDGSGSYTMDITKKELRGMLRNYTKDKQYTQDDEDKQYTKKETEKKLNDFFKQYRSYGFGYLFTITDAQQSYPLGTYAKDTETETDTDTKLPLINVKMQRTFLGFPLIYWGVGVIVVIVLIIGAIYYFKDKLFPRQKGKKTEKDKKNNK